MADPDIMPGLGLLGDILWAIKKILTEHYRKLHSYNFSASHFILSSSPIRILHLSLDFAPRLTPPNLLTIRSLVIIAGL